uniref:Putative metalloprotease n=1 Tax=Arthrobacter sp. 32c TaxID=663598 RepID=C7ASJ4_9MICC|nr:putative metalloprotease [Arthrobacter sp. 32c]
MRSGLHTLSKEAPMINRRHFLTTVAVGTASAAALAACGTGSSTSAGETGSAENPVTINYTWWGNDDRAERTRKAIALFEEKNPDIKVNGNFTDFAGYWQKRATEAAGGGLPDVMQWDLSYLRDYGQRNQLLDLGTVNINTDAFEKSLLPSGQIKGKTYGIPTSTNAFAVYYDPAKLASLGIAEPDGTWTYQEFNDFLAEVGAKSNGEIYVARHFPETHKARMQALVANLTEAYRQSITAVGWMGDATKAEALRKLEGFRAKIGYPDQWIDYSAVEIDPTDLLGNVERAHNADVDRHLDEVGKPVDRNKWLMTPQTVNAYYHPMMNEIVFPAAILQPPFFTADADDAVNYGGIGAVIGHEIGHGFDDQGSQFDGGGALRNWWTEEDRQAFEKPQPCLVHQHAEAHADFSALRPQPFGFLMPLREVRCIQRFVEMLNYISRVEVVRLVDDIKTRRPREVFGRKKVSAPKFRLTETDFFACQIKDPLSSESGFIASRRTISANRCFVGEDGVQSSIISRDPIGAEHNAGSNVAD